MQVDNNEITIKELLNKFKNWKLLLKTKLKIILLISSFGAIIGFLYSYNKGPEYKAILTFTLEEEKNSGGGSLGGAIGIANSLGIDLGGSSSTGSLFSMSSLTELMQSRLIVEKTLLTSFYNGQKNVVLANEYLKIYNFKLKSRNEYFELNSNRGKFTIEQDSILNEIYKKVISNNLNVRQKDKKISILSIEFISKNELFSKAFSENLANEVSDYYIEIKSKRAKTNYEILQKQADSVRIELNNAIQGVAYEADNVYNLNPAFNIKSTNSKKKQVDVQANTAILTQLIAQLELSKVNLRKETPLIQIIDKPILPLTDASLSPLISTFIGFTTLLISCVLFFTLQRIYFQLLN